MSDACLPPPLRLGLLVPGLRLARWQRSVLEQLVAGGDAELVVVVEEETAATRRRGPLDRRFLWRLYNNVWVRRRAASIAQGRLLRPARRAADVAVTTRTCGRYAQHFPPTAIERLARTTSLDVLLRFGFGILGGEVLDVARHGIWSFHHDDERVIRGGPPSFWEVADGHATTGVLLQRLTERLDAGIPLGRATFRTVGHSYPRNRDRAALGAAVLVARAARAVRHGWLDAASLPPQPPTRRSGGTRRTARCSRFLARQAVRIVTAQVRGILIGHRWTVGLTKGEPALGGG